MSLTTVLLLSIPAVALLFKLFALAFVVVLAVRAAGPGRQAAYSAPRRALLSSRRRGAPS